MCLLETLGQSFQDITRSDHSYAKLVYLSKGVDICLFKSRPDEKDLHFFSPSQCEEKTLNKLSNILTYDLAQNLEN